jgi:hypothetical protein
LLVTLGHIDGKLRARSTVLGHHSDDPSGIMRRLRHVLAIFADANRLAESQECQRVGVDHFADVVGVVVPCALESGNLPPQEPRIAGVLRWPTPGKLAADLQRQAAAGYFALAAQVPESG